MELPALIHDFSHAQIEQVVVGPRRELTLELSLVIFDCGKGRAVLGIKVRFGGIANFDEVAASFMEAPQEKSELAYLRYSTKKKSKLGNLFFDLVFERTDARIEIQCRNLAVG